MTELVGWMLRRGSEQKKEGGGNVEESHVKLQEDTQTLFVLPAVPKLSKRGQPGAYSCSAVCRRGKGGADTEGIREDVSVFQRCSRHICCQSLLSPGRVKTCRKSPKSCAAVTSLHFDFVVCYICLVSSISFYFIFVLRDVIVHVFAVSGNWR